MLRLVVLAAGALGASNADGGSADTSGAAGCRCLAADLQNTSYARNGTLWLATNTGLFKRGLDYGSYCRAWDDGLPPGCDAAQPEQKAFCGHPWCWVDPLSCNLAMAASPWLRGAGLHYSYLTCGSPDLWKTDNLQTGLRGKPLRFAFPAELVPWHYRGSDGKWEGLMWDWLMLLQERAGFELLERNVTSKNASKWDACVEDIHKGLLDVCPTVSWVVKNRAQRAVFASPVVWSDFSLLVNATPMEEGSKMMQAFRPFSETFYWALLGIVICTAGAFFLLEGGHIQAEAEDEDGSEGMEEAQGTFGSAEPSAPAHPPERVERRPDMRRKTLRIALFTLPTKELRVMVRMSPLQIFMEIAVKLMFNLYYILFGIFTGNVPINTRTCTGKVLRTAFAFFALVTTASYTANLAAFLVLEDTPKTAISSIEDCIAHHYPVCVAEQIEFAVRKLYPTLTIRVEPSSTATLKGLRSGACNASLIPLHDYRARPDFQDCRETVTGGVIMGMSVASPMTADIVNSYSFHTISLHQEGAWQILHERFRPKTMDFCRIDAKKVNGPDRIGPNHFLGMWMVYGAFVVLAITMRVCYRCSKVIFPRTTAQFIEVYREASTKAEAKQRTPQPSRDPQKFCMRGTPDELHSGTSTPAVIGINPAGDPLPACPPTSGAPPGSSGAPCPISTL